MNATTRVITSLNSYPCLKKPIMVCEIHKYVHYTNDNENVFRPSMTFLWSTEFRLLILSSLQKSLIVSQRDLANVQFLQYWS